MVFSGVIRCPGAGVVDGDSDAHTKATAAADTAKLRLRTVRRPRRIIRDEYNADASVYGDHQSPPPDKLADSAAIYREGSSPPRTLRPEVYECDYVRGQEVRFETLGDEGGTNGHALHGAIEGRRWEEARRLLLHDGENDEHYDSGAAGAPSATGRSSRSPWGCGAGEVGIVVGADRSSSAVTRNNTSAIGLSREAFRNSSSLPGGVPMKDADPSPSSQGRKLAATWTIRKRKDGSVKWRILPLHAAALFGAPVSVMTPLVTAFPSAAKLRDDRENLPLHLAFRSGLGEDCISILMEAYPPAVDHVNDVGRTPFECMEFSGKKSALLEYVGGRRREGLVEREAFRARLEEVEHRLLEEHEQVLLRIREETREEVQKFILAVSAEEVNVREAPPPREEGPEAVTAHISPVGGVTDGETTNVMKGDDKSHMPEEERIKENSLPKKGGDSVRKVSPEEEERSRMPKQREVISKRGRNFLGKMRRSSRKMIRGQALRSELGETWKPGQAVGTTADEAKENDTSEKRKKIRAPDAMQSGSVVAMARAGVGTCDDQSKELREKDDNREVEKPTMVNDERIQPPKKDKTPAVMEGQAEKLRDNVRANSIGNEAEAKVDAVTKVDSKNGISSLGGERENGITAIAKVNNGEKDAAESSNGGNDKNVTKEVVKSPSNIPAEVEEAAGRVDTKMPSSSSCVEHGGGERKSDSEVMETLHHHPGCSEAPVGITPTPITSAPRALVLSPPPAAADAVFKPSVDEMKHTTSALSSGAGPPPPAAVDRVE